MSAGAEARGGTSAWKLAAAFAVVYLVWGSTYLAIRFAVETIPPLLLVAVRCVVAGGLLLGWSRLRGARRATAAEWREAAIAGGFLFLGGLGLVAWSEQRVTSGVAAVLNATIPLFVVGLGWRGGRWLGGGKVERPGASTLTAVVLGLGGVLLLVLAGGSGTAARVDPLAVMALLVASLSWSAGLLRAGAHGSGSTIERAGMQLVAGGGLVVIASAVTGDATAFDPGALTSRSIAALVYLVVFGSLLAFVAWLWLVAHAAPEKVASHAYVNPLVAVGLGAAVAGEAVSPAMLLATVLVLTSVVLVGRSHGHQPAARPLPGTPAGVSSLRRASGSRRRS